MPKKDRALEAKIHLFGERIAVRPDKDAVTSGGIHLPDKGREAATRGTVVAVGPGRFSDYLGKCVPMSVTPGTHIEFRKYGSDEISVDGETLLVIRENELIAAIPSEDDAE